MKSFFSKKGFLIIDLLGSIFNKIGISRENRLREVDKVLNYEYDNIVVILYKGLCSSDVDKDDGYLRKHRIKNTYSVYPNDEVNSKKILDNYFDIKYINDNSNYKAYGISGNDEVYEKIINISKNDGKKVIYCYCDSYSDVCKLSNDIKGLVDSLNNSVVLVSSYCGKDMKDEVISLEDNKDFISNISNLRYINNRCIIFDSCDINSFSTYFYEDFKLLSYDEVVSKEMYVDGEFQYMLCCKGNKSFKGNFKGISGGLTEDEVVFPMMIFEKKREDEREVIRKATSDDFGEVLKLMNEVFLKRWERRKDIFEKVQAIGRNEFSKYCGKHKADGIYVYELDGNIVGYIMWDVKPFINDIHYNRNNIMIFRDVYVLEEYRRSGIATKLYNEALKYAKKLKISRVEFRVWEFDEETLEFINSLHVEKLRSCYEIKI